MRAAGVVCDVGGANGLVLLVPFPKPVAVEEPKALFVVLPFPKNESADTEGGAPNVAPPKADLAVARLPKADGALPDEGSAVPDPKALVLDANVENADFAGNAEPVNGEGCAAKAL